MADAEPLDQVLKERPESRVLVRRISEELQKDESVMAALRRVGALPDKVVTVVSGAGGVMIGSGGETAEIEPELSAHLFVKRL
jgi:DtxR family transcriptional regulator, Mn-dependent transcriptional regulator